MSRGGARALLVLVTALMYLFAGSMIVSRDAASLAVVAGAHAVWMGAFLLWEHVVYPRRSGRGNGNS